MARPTPRPSPRPAPPVGLRPRGSRALLLAVCALALAPAALASPLRPVGPPRPAAQQGLHGLSRRPTGDPSWRLPDGVRPLHYDIHIAPDLDGLFFIGSVDITLQVDKRVDKLLTLHADGSLRFSECTLDGEQVQHAPSRDGKDFINFMVPKALESDSQHVLHCDYSGKIFQDDKGFYLSKYKLKDGLTAVPVKLGVTQFEMTFARRALPCFDEPGYRATFALAITHRVEQSAISNTRPQLILPVNETHAQTTFEPTPAMAVYTLAWVVSQMPNVSSLDGTFHTYAPPKYIDSTALSQAVGPQVLAGMEDYTGIPYALDKMDQVAVPDFNFGAMENWGLVTYRQGLLVSGAGSRATTNLSVTTTIAHELAHQWFGNLVTPSWWGHVWLSEAFAELFCYLMTDKINPEWKVLDKMPLMEMHDAFVEDSLVSAAPMTNENIFTPDEILDNFGSITYAKGSSVLRMLRDAMDSVSADSFQKGLQSYLSTMQESGVVKPDDLWTALESQGVAFPGGLTVTQLGKKWTEQAGYPLITVTRSGDSVTVTQERFLSSGEKPATPVSWPVPLTWRAQGADSVQRPFLTKDSDSISGIPKDAAWVLFNVDQLGYYRVNYDDDGWQALISALRSDPGALSAPERAMLVDDALVLARAGRLPYATALSLLEYLSAERQYAPWAALAASIQHLSMQCRAAGDQDVLSKAFNKWLAGLTKKAFSTLDFESSPTDTFEDKLARSVVAQVAYEAANFEAVTQASLKYLDSTEGIALDPDTARLALCQGLADSKIDDVFRRFWEELEYSTDEMKRRDYTYALGCAPENFDLKLKTEILKRLTTAPPDETAKIDARDLKALWKSLLASELGLTTAVKYVVTNAEKIASLRGDGELTTILTTLAAQIATKDNRDTLASLKLPRFDAVLKNCLATVDANLAWRAANLASITSYLNGDETTTPTGTTETTTPSGSTQTTQPTQPTQPTPAPTLPPAAYRLPTTVSPSGYRLHLTVAGFDTFEGSVTVDILPDDEDVTAIVMHASGLNISLQDVRVYETYAKDVVVDVTDVILSPEVEQVSIKLKSALQPGLAYSVDIKYTGSMRSDFTGLYHTTTGGRDMVGTRLYPAYARRVLPCFDEPHFRTPFSVSVLHDQGLVAVGSNKPPLRRGLRNAVVQDDFDVTTSIPTSQLGIYLVDYRALKHLDSDGLTVSGRQELLDAAKKSDMLSQAQGLVWWFGNASGVAAAPEHLNLLGVTSSFEDAVSAWGVVAMRESDMVNMDTSPSSGASEQNWLTQLSRSLAQIWFGGQVSADWWDSAWISQGFATFYQYSVPASLQPAWQLPYQLYTRAIAPALLADSFEGAHPLNADVSGAQDSIAIAHDVIASGKGGAVVQMLSHVLEGNGAFDEGVKSLFHDGIKLPHTIESADLLSAMEVAAKKLNADTKLPGGVSLKDAVSTWVDASGYPVVNVIRDYNAKTATISQERFLQHTPSQSPAGGAAWWVPLSYALREEYLSRGYTPKVPLKTWLAPDQTLNVDLASSDDWLLVNADRREFFRVNYDVRNWKKLEEYLREYPKLIEPVARAMLVDDALALSRAGRLDYAVALEFLDYLRLEEDLHPWEAARPGFQYLDAQLLGSRHEAVYKKWLLQLLERAVQEAGFIPDERDSHLQRLTRAVVTAWACDLGQDSCTRYAKRNFDAWITDPNGVGHDTLGAAVCVGLRQGDATTLKTVVAKLADVEDSAQRAAIISGLGCGGNVHALFDLTVRPGLQRGEPALLWGSATRFGPADLTQSLHCFTMMHRRVAARYGKDSIVDIARVLANRVTTQQQLDLLSPLVVDIDAGLLQGALLLARDNVAWREDNLDAVADVLYALTDTPDPDLPTTTSTSTSTTTPGTIPPGPTVTDPATATAGTTASAWTQPPTAATTANTLPTLEPKTVPPGPSPTDPATASTASGSTTWWSIPTTASTAPPTLPPLETTTSGPITTPGAGTSSGPDTPPTPVPSTTPNSASALAASTALLLVALAAAVVN